MFHVRRKRREHSVIAVFELKHVQPFVRRLIYHVEATHFRRRKLINRTRAYTVVARHAAVGKV